MEDIKPRKLAVTLSRYVTKTPAGIGLGIPETMEMALRECGTLRILFAAFAASLASCSAGRGWFYIVAGPKARGIDGPTEAPPTLFVLPLVAPPPPPPPRPAPLPRAGRAPRGAPGPPTPRGPPPWAAPTRRSPPWPCWPGILGTTPWVSPVSAPQWASSAKYDIRAAPRRESSGAPLLLPLCLEFIYIFHEFMQKLELKFILSVI